MFHQMFIILGILFSYTLGSITTYPMMIGVCIVWPIFHMFVTFIFMPESPYYMYKLQYHQNKIEITLRLIKGRKYDVNADYNDVQVTRRSRRNIKMFIVLFQYETHSTSMSYAARIFVKKNVLFIAIHG